MSIHNGGRPNCAVLLLVTCDWSIKIVAAKVHYLLYLNDLFGLLAPYTFYPALHNSGLLESIIMFLIIVR